MHCMDDNGYGVNEYGQRRPLAIIVDTINFLNRQGSKRSRGMKSGRALRQNDAIVESDNGATPLHSAARKGKLDLIRLLLEDKADVHARDKCRQDTPLHQAAFYSPNPEVIALLVAASADVNAVNEVGELPLDLAMQAQRQAIMFGFKGAYDTHLLVVQALRERGAVESMVSCGNVKKH